MLLLLLHLALDLSEHDSGSSLLETRHRREARQAPIGRNSAKGKGAPRLYRKGAGGGKGVSGVKNVKAVGRRASGSGGDDVVTSVASVETVVEAVDEAVETVERWDALLPSVVTDARVFSPRSRDPYLGFACYHQPIPHAADELVSVVRFEPVVPRPQNVHHITVFGCSADVVRPSWGKKKTNAHCLWAPAHILSVSQSRHGFFPHLSCAVQPQIFPLSFELLQPITTRHSYARSRETPSPLS